MKEKIEKTDEITKAMNRAVEEALARERELTKKYTFIEFPKMKQSDYDVYQRINALLMKSELTARMHSRKCEILGDFLMQIRRGHSLTEKQLELLEDYEDWYEESGRDWAMESRTARAKRCHLLILVIFANVAAAGVFMHRYKKKAIDYW